MIQTSTQFDYSRKRDIGYKEIMAPEGDPAWIFDRQVLWNKVENSEKRVDSMLARHIDAALPVELSLDTCKAMVKEFVKTNFTDKGMVADVAFHDMDSHNPHAHILLTTREIEGDGFADKNVRHGRPVTIRAAGGYWLPMAPSRLNGSTGSSPVTRRWRSRRRSPY